MLMDPVDEFVLAASLFCLHQADREGRLDLALAAPELADLTGISPLLDDALDWGRRALAAPQDKDLRMQLLASCLHLAGARIKGAKAAALIERQVA